MSEAPDFICEDCGSAVYLLPRGPAPDPPLCATCDWLRECIPDDAERAELRERMLGKAESPKRGPATPAES